MKVIISALFLFLIALTAKQAMGQTATSVDITSIPSGPHPVIHFEVVDQVNGGLATSGNVSIKLCYEDMTSCPDSCGNTVDGTGYGSCLLNINVNPGVYWLTADYSDDGIGNYAPSHFQRMVAGDAGGGISLNAQPPLFFLGSKPLFV